MSNFVGTCKNLPLKPAIMRPKTAGAPTTTYKDDYQNPKCKQNEKQDEKKNGLQIQRRPKTASVVVKKAENIRKVEPDVKCAFYSFPMSPLQFQICPQQLQNAQNSQQQSQSHRKSHEGENRLIINANCVHLNVYMPNHLALNLQEKSQSKCPVKGVVAQTKIDQAKMAKKTIDDFWKAENKIEPKKNDKVVKLFDPPWGYKGHQPKPVTSSDFMCCFKAGNEATGNDLNFF